MNSPLNISLLNKPSKQSGLSMVEVLVTLVILMVGLLGLAGLQMQGLRSEMESYQRVQALVLLKDMAGRINTNRGNRNQAGCLGIGNQAAQNTCEWNAITASISSYLADDIGVGSVAVCNGLTGQDRDTCEWGNALRGAGVTDGGASIGTMIGGRGCIRQVSADANQITVEISVAWQGLGKSFQAENTCGQGEYGDDDTLRRVVSLTTQIGNLR